MGRRQELERQVKLQSIPQALNLANAQTAFPLQQLGAVQQFGALPRQIQQSVEDAIFNQQLQTTFFPFEQQFKAASTVLNREAFFIQQEAAKQGILDQIGQVASLGFTGSPNTFGSPTPGSPTTVNQPSGTPGTIPGLLPVPSPAPTFV